MKNVNALNGAELSDLFFEFLEKKGHRDLLKAMDLVARHWFRDAVILEEEDFSEELPRLRYYSELTEESVIDVICDVPVADWLECCYPVRIERIEKERGIPSTLEVLPSVEMRKLEQDSSSWTSPPPRTDLPNYPAPLPRNNPPPFFETRVPYEKALIALWVGCTGNAVRPIFFWPLSGECQCFFATSHRWPVLRLASSGLPGSGRLC